MWQSESSVILSEVRMHPCWAMMLVTEPVQCRFPCSFLENSPLSWYSTEIVDSMVQKWVVHGSSGWSQVNLTKESHAIQALMLKELENHLGLHLAVKSTSVHRWMFASGYSEETYRPLWDEKVQLGYTGDWLCGGQVEGAMNGSLLLSRMIK